MFFQVEKRCFILSDLYTAVEKTDGVPSLNLEVPFFFLSPRKAVYILDSCVTKCPIYTTIKNTEARMPGYIPLVRCPAITARCLKFLFNSFFYIFQPQKCEIYMLYSIFFFHLPLKIPKFFSSLLFNIQRFSWHLIIPPDQTRERGKIEWKKLEKTEK